MVIWKPHLADVYLATRSLGGSMKVSLHASGECFVRAPNPKSWKGSGAAPRYLDKWLLDVSSTFQFPFSVVVPEQELRIADWAPHREKGTIWINPRPGFGVEVGVFLIRSDQNQDATLEAGGWYETIVDTPLPDGRRLIVAAGTAGVPSDRIIELEAIRVAAQRVIAGRAEPARNPRMILFAGPNDLGTRKFIEAAVTRAA